jgi:hypothetical protein
VKGRPTLRRRTRCACGCGQLANPDRKYVQGHQPRQRSQRIVVGTRVRTEAGMGVVAHIESWDEAWSGGRVGHARGPKPHRVTQLLVVYDDGRRALVAPSECEVQARELRAQDGDGAIVSCVELDTGATLTRHYGGTVMAAVFRVVTELRERNGWGERWRVRCISTPPSIYRDLQASRVVLDGTSLATVPQAEWSIMAKLGALDLLERRQLSMPLPSNGQVRVLA